MTFLDTNVLVYAADDTDEAKHRRAYDLVVRAIRGESFMVSAQVLNEFAFVMYRKFNQELRQPISGTNDYRRRP